MIIAEYPGQVKTIANSLNFQAVFSQFSVLRWIISVAGIPLGRENTKVEW
jgi:hypothetical protein